jgi:hypothetical protein
MFAGFIYRFGKPLAVTVIMFLSILYITHDIKTATIGALIPLLLGSLNMMTSVAYGLSSLALILAVVTAVAPVSLKNRVMTVVSQTTSSIR